MDPMSDLLSEFYAVQQLQILVREPAHAHREREFLVRCAVVVDRLAEATGSPETVVEQMANAVLYAQELLAHDRAHGTGTGPIPAVSDCWADDPRGYARQEHRAWILDTLSDLGDLQPPRS